MKVLRNNLSDIPLISRNVDSDRDLKFIPKSPLPKRGSMYICGAPWSGKSSLWYAMLLSKPTKSRPGDKRYYNKYFGHVEVISNSMSTIPTDEFRFPYSQLHGEYSDELLMHIVQKLKSGDDLNSLVIIDDCIRDLSRSKILDKYMKCTTDDRD